MRSPRLIALTLLVSIAAGCASTSPTSGGSQVKSSGPNASGAAGGHESPPPGEERSPDEGWEKIRDEDGIIVHKKEVEGSPLVAFRGAGVVNAPIHKVVFVLIDLARTPEWVERVQDARIIREISESEYVTYTHLGAPLIVSDREFVSRAKISIEPGKMIRFTMNATEDPDAPRHGKYVRGELIGSSWEVRPIDASHTHVVAEIHADPKGNLPRSIVNFLQTSWAHKTITALRRQAAKPDLTENPRMLARLKEHKLME